VTTGADRDDEANERSTLSRLWIEVAQAIADIEAALAVRAQPDGSARPDDSHPDQADPR
jgi:hypothetical protein